jgi:hypothetical protein
MAPAAQLLIVENNGQKSGLSNELLRSEFLRAAKLEQSIWCATEIPNCKNGAKWPASGMTLFSAGSDRVARGLSDALQSLELLPESAASSISVAKNILERTSGLLAFIRPGATSSEAPKRERRALLAAPVATATAAVATEIPTTPEESAALISEAPLTIADQGIRFSQTAAKPAEKVTNEAESDEFGALISGAQLS